MRVEKREQELHEQFTGYYRALSQNALHKLNHAIQLMRVDEIWRIKYFCSLQKTLALFILKFIFF
jgi:hypothetical protein